VKNGTKHSVCTTTREIIGLTERDPKKLVRGRCGREKNSREKSENPRTIKIKETK